ncbi:SulP family inorganic anion transporter [Shewanella sp. FJAT-52076]|uniref:SulP family inorganic anion transporter n=1 Tax=Shewanella sp. FJAT-52076 TaxID=2864202 RepID=UPI001C65F2C8|nr:SulP family inorganic anion transporter [Shewanella sp. FJAT-52076]QYJ76124.1 SulP family inorganic anion transporter [Shewanella sp. FJAT-52076]
MPIFNAFDSKSRTSDLMGGVTAAIVSLPLALAFGVASGAGAQAGIYGALLVGLFAALFGGTRTLISEPTGPMTVVTTAVIASFTATHPDKGLAMAFTVVMLAGLVQIILGALKFGRYITLMPYSVISGFMSGIGVLLIILQLPNLVGVAGISGGAVGVIEALPTLIGNIKWQELALALSALALMQIVPKLIKMRLPPQLLALVFCTLASVLLLDIEDVRRIGEINIGLPSLIIPTFTYGELTHMLISAVMLGALGCIDSLITAVIADRLTRVEHNSNKELIGQGLGNIASGLCGGLPGAGSTMGTVVNIQAGASSALSGVVRVLTLLIVFSLAAGIVEYIPMAVLAAIAFKVGLNILDWAFVKRAHQLSRSAAMTMYVVMVLTVFVDLIVAVGVGMFIANLITIDRLSQLQERNINAINDSGEASDMRPNEKRMLDAINEKSNTLLLSLSGPMIFGVAKTLQRESIAVKSAETLVLDLCRVPYMDSTTGLAIENVLLDAKDCGCNVYLVVPRKYSWEANFIDHHSDLPIFHSRADALSSLAASLGIEVDELNAKAAKPGGAAVGKATSGSASL